MSKGRDPSKAVPQVDESVVDRRLTTWIWGLKMRVVSVRLMHHFNVPEG